MKTLSERWSDWLSDLGGAQSSSSFALKARDVERHIVPELLKDGFGVPITRDVAKYLEAGLDPLPVEANYKATWNDGKSVVCTFSHLVNLLWQGIIKHIETLASGAKAPWTSKLQANHEALVAEMEGIIADLDESMAFDVWCTLIKQYLSEFVEAEVPLSFIKEVMSDLAPLTLDTTHANALHVLRSSVCSKLVGRSLAAQVNRKVLAKVLDVPVNLIADEHIQKGLKSDLVENLQRLHCRHDLDDDSQTLGQPAKKLKRDRESLEGSLEAKTRQALWVLENKMCLSKCTSTLVSASELILKLKQQDEQDKGGPLLTDLLVSNVNLAKHMLFLDAAVDRCTSETLFNQREAGTFGGVAIATDESPPDQPRFRGLRFQITVLYFGTFVPLSDWQHSQVPPIIRTTCLGDIMHCPGKKGTDVSRILEKQLARVGLNTFDVVAGTGDGGGENEGHQGVHAHFENLNPGYVRHRCLPHIAWRTADQAISASGLSYKNLAAYLVEGITWNRFREIATRAPADGGLSLCRDGSQRCKDLFGTAPQAIISTRPDTDLKFLQFLRGKEHDLYNLATKDLTQRDLGPTTREAVVHLGDIGLRLRRAILAEILHRSLFLLHWNGKHRQVAQSSSWDELMEKAVLIIQDLSLTTEVLERLQFSEETLDALPVRPKSWVELVVLQVVGDGDEALVAARLPEALDFHRSVTDAAGSHLALIGDNTFRTSWLAAKLLSVNQDLAQKAAKDLVKHLATTRPGNRTSFEKHIFESEPLWKTLVDFADSEPAVLLWHGHGKFEPLFKFLAPRFLLAPDHVLDCERVHARWQWSCSQRRALKMFSLNALLRLTHYLEHNQFFPSHQDLLPHLQAEIQDHRLALQAVHDEDIALGWRSEWIFRDRLGLSVGAHRLLGN